MKRALKHPLTGEVIEIGCGEPRDQCAKPGRPISRRQNGEYPRDVRIAVPGGYFTVVQRWPWTKAHASYVRAQARALWGQNRTPFLGVAA